MSELSAEVRHAACSLAPVASHRAGGCADASHPPLSHPLWCVRQIESQPPHRSLFLPMGRETAQILRFVADEALLLNSREKAPFMLLVEARCRRAAVCASPRAVC